MKRLLFILIVLSFASGKIGAQSFTANDLVALTSLSSKNIDQYMGLQPPPLYNPHMFRPHLDSKTKMRYSSQFSASPPILHFTGLVAGTENIQILSIINRSAKSQRLLIVPPSSGNFSIEYEKRGLLAPGMAQKVTVKFNPTEFKYYYDAAYLLFQ